MASIRPSTISDRVAVDQRRVDVARDDLPDAGDQRPHGRLSGDRPRRRRPPRPGPRSGRAAGPRSVTARASSSSSAPGASGTAIVTASKCDRTSIALMWWTGMSSVAPIAARFLTDGRIDTPPTALARRRAELRVEDGGDVLELAVLADDAALAVRLDRLAEGLLAAAGQLVAEVLAEVDQLCQVVGPACPRTGSSRRRRPRRGGAAAPARARHRRGSPHGTSPTCGSGSPRLPPPTGLRSPAQYAAPTRGTQVPDRSGRRS